MNYIMLFVRYNSLFLIHYLFFIHFKMKQTFLILTFLFFVFAFTQTQEDVYKKISLNACDCIKKLDEKSTEEDFGICIMSEMGRLTSKEREIIKLDVNSSEGSEKFGQEVGFSLVANCPDFLNILNKRKRNKQLAQKNQIQNNELIAAFLELKTSQFIEIIVKTENNSNLNFIWLKEFEGDTLLQNNLIQKGTKLKINYFMMNLYDPIMKEYRNFNVLNKLEKL